MVLGYCFAFFFPPFLKPRDRAGVHLLPVVWAVLQPQTGVPHGAWRVPPWLWPKASCDCCLLDPTSITEKSSNRLRT